MKSFDRRFRHARKVNTHDKVYLEIEDGCVKRDMLSNGVKGAFQIVEAEKTTNSVAIQFCDVVEQVAMNRLVRVTSSAPVNEAKAELQATSKDLEKKCHGMKEVFHEAHVGSQ